MSSLLLEMRVEEIPAGYIRPALEDMKRVFSEQLASNRISAAHVRATGTPRRLCLQAEGIPPRQEDIEVTVQGPPAKIAFDADGNPTKAALGFAKAQGVTPDAIEMRETDKGLRCCVVKKEAGKPAVDALPAILAQVVNSINFPNSMKWAGSDGKFARPVRSIAALFGDAVIPVEAYGIKSGNTTTGHPFLNDYIVELTSADYPDYCAKMRNARVIVDIEERTNIIRKGLEKRVQAHAGGKVGISEKALLAEVVMLVEWPLVIEGSFDEEFLKLPDAVIKAAMMEHQRYFPVKDTDGKLLARFLCVADRDDDESGLIREGNERVLRARLSDARYFYQADGRQTLEQRVDQLSHIQFMAGLGSYRDKVERLSILARAISEKSGLDSETEETVTRAALLCKSDLLTEMVGEFPSLQGEIGGIYALRDGETKEVAEAIFAHYMPKSAIDELPDSSSGRILALADKMDNLAGGFALDLAPTGSQDPYALRRQANAAIRLSESLGGIALDRGANFSIEELIILAGDLVSEDDEKRGEVISSLLEFAKDRLYQICLDRGVPHDIARAAMASGWGNTADFAERVRCLNDFISESEWPALVEVVERTFNIARSAESTVVDESLFDSDEEKFLWRVYLDSKDEINKLIEKRDYFNACISFAMAFAKPVHDFFENVFVNIDNKAVRLNRLALLKNINLLFSEKIADLSQIVTGVG